MPGRPAVVLLSGGLDSATTLAIARTEGFDPIALTVRYGQRHEREIEAARKVATAFGVRRHEMVEFDLKPFGGSALTDPAIQVPKDRSSPEMESSIPVTYVPARNTIFLAFALSLAEASGAFDIFAGVNAVDYSGYPDCRPAFIRSFEKLANLATRAGVEAATQNGAEPFRVHTPLILLRKHEIIRRGLELGVDYSMTHSCYDPAPDGRACGRCDSCRIRLEGFRLAGIADPARYVRI